MQAKLVSRNYDVDIILERDCIGMYGCNGSPHTQVFMAQMSKIIFFNESNKLELSGDGK